ncbi:MAG: hypothetical protein EOO04_19410 [Chitinophagaceae bacterium]|nr:MAG: hypothetical protein EOO04_19410 [Chitinophagaceae bacterium]
MKFGIWIGAVIMIAFAFTAWVMYTKGNPDVMKSSPDFSVTTSALFDAFKQDSQMAAKNFTDKIVRVKGAVKKVDTSGSIIMADEAHNGEIILAIDLRYHDALKSVKTGDTVTAQGVFDNFTADIPNPDDMLSGLGATIRFRAAGIAKK